MERKNKNANWAFLRQLGKFEGKFTATWPRDLGTSVRVAYSGHESMRGAQGVGAAAG
jgi:hypothetical protein